MGVAQVCGDRTDSVRGPAQSGRSPRPLKGKRPNKEKERGPTRKRVSHSYYCVAVVIPTRTGHLFGWRHSYYCVAVVIPTSIYGVAIYIGRTDIWTSSIYIFC